MNKNYLSKFWFIFIVSSWIHTVSFSQTEQSKLNHPLVSGPVGYDSANEASVKEFDTFTSGLAGEFICNSKDKKCDNSVPGFMAGKFIAEGKVTRLTYVNLKNPASDLAILRSYEHIFKQLGGIKLTSDLAPVKGTHLFYVDRVKTWMILDNVSPKVYLTFLEQKSFEQIVTAGQLADQINKQGFVNLNVNFVTNKSLIKDGDKLAINEVVALLKEDPKLRLSVEGHTDNVGNAAANKTLSQARSDSLVAYIVAAGISANRLVARGFGSESPISDNRTDEGKAKNRRVELVKIK